MKFKYSLTFKTIVPLVMVVGMVMGIFAFYLSTAARDRSKEFLVEKILIPELESLVKEEDLEFERVKMLTEFLAQKIENKIQVSKKRTSEETDELFNGYMSKKLDGSYRSSLDELKGRYQMAAFINNEVKPDTRLKGMFVDAFLYFDPFADGQLPFVFTTYFVSKNSIWQYGFPDWALKSSANETFDKYGWFYGADPVHNPDKGHKWTDMYFDELQGQWMISSLMPIYDGDEFLGVVGQDLILQKIIEVTKGRVVRRSGVLFFIDNLKNIVAHPEIVGVINKKVANDQRLDLKAVSDEPLTKALQMVEVHKQGYVFTEESDRRVVVYFPLTSVDWDVVYVINESELLKFFDQINREYVVIIVLFGILVMGLIGFLVKFLVSDPLKMLTKTTVEISEGDLTKRIDIKSQDEVGELAESFNKMTSRLQQFYQDLEEKVKERTVQLEDNMKVVNEQNESLVKTKTAMINIMEDQKELEEALKREKAEVEEKVSERTKELNDEKVKLSASIENLPVGYLMVNIGESLIMTNLLAKQILKGKNDQENLVNLKKLVEGRVDLTEFIKDCGEKKKGLVVDGVDVRGRFYNLLFSPILVGGGEVACIGVVVLLQDVTEASVLERSKDEFFSIASHELRTPLTAIRGNTSMIQEFYKKEISNPELQGMIADIHESSVRLIDIVNDFLNLSRLEQGRMEFAKEKVDLSQLITEVIKEYQVTGSRSKVNIEFEPFSGKIPEVIGDSDKLRQVLINLIGNSLKFTKDGEVKVSLKLEEGLVRVRVTDTGCGISLKQQALLFHKFQQAGESIVTRDTAHGTGLGLYISKMMIEGMGGEIGLEKSIEGKGSTFFFILPVGISGK